MKEESNKTAAQALGECLQWACSPRGGNNFYGRVLNGCGKQVNHYLGTAGVRLDRLGRYILEWDPEWFVAQPRPFQLIVIVHEAAHLMLRHIERAVVIKRQLQDDQKARRLHEVINIAMDMAANDVAVRPMTNDHNMQFKNYKDLIIWPEDRDYPPNKTFEEYLGILLQDLKDHGWDPNDDGAEVPEQSSAPGAGAPQSGNEKEKKPQEKDGAGGSSAQKSGKKKKQQKGGGGKGKEQNTKGDDKGEGKLPQWFKNLLNKKHRTVDWSKIFDKMTDGETRRVLDRAKREAKKITRQAVNQTKKSRGTIPGGIQSVVDDLLDDPVIPWQEVLRGMLRSQISQKLNESTAYPSVALLNDESYEPYPGYQNNFTFRILAAFDTSGSMSEDEFRDCCKELKGLLTKEDGVSVDLIQFDHAIQHQENLTTEDAKAKHRTRYGHGGTSFKHPLRYALQQDDESDWMTDAEREEKWGGPFDLMLMFTDGYAPIPLPELDPRIPLFWVLTANGQEDPLMKFVLRMEE